MSETTIVYWLSQILLLLVIVSMTLFAVWKRRGSKEFLCGDCRFNDARFCLKPERPTAVDCTSYRPALPTPTVEESH